MNHIGREQCNGRMVDLDSMTVKESPKEFFNSFIDKGLNARLPVSIFQCIIKHQISVQVSCIPWIYISLELLY